MPCEAFFGGSEVAGFESIWLNFVFKKKGNIMLNKLFLFVLVVCAFCNAAMIGDFSPMKVGNKWVYSDQEYAYYATWFQERIIKIISTIQNGDSIFFTILDSISSNDKTIKKYLTINSSNFLYDTSSKTYGPPEDFFKFHQLPDSMLTKVIFSNQTLYSYSITNSVTCGWSSARWIQNFGLFSNGSISGCAHTETSSELKLVSFNDQPVDSSISTIVYKNPVSSRYANSPIYSDTRSQIHWRGLSGADHLSLQLFDYRGRLLFSSSQLPGTYVYASQFPSGAYNLKYRVNNGIWKQFAFMRN